MSQLQKVSAANKRSWCDIYSARDDIGQSRSSWMSVNVWRFSVLAFLTETKKPAIANKPARCFRERRAVYHWEQRSFCV